jgi:arylsulfatase A-like enzyme
MIPIMVSRRRILQTPLLSAAAMGRGVAKQRATRPNVILMITDDQGIGDLSLTGNPYLKTPNIDRIGKEGVQFTQFHVSPVCAPTRASLMTGRYNYRTGVVDTYLGRAMMDPRETTLPQLLEKDGYATGLFGKWHLGDNYPLRPSERGFQTSLMHLGGGIGQPSDPPAGNSYFDPWLLENNNLVRKKGYCTDVFADATIDFISRNRTRPFFAYFATNAPHDPLQVDAAAAKVFTDRGLDANTAKTYAMIENIDHNVGRILASLQQQGLDEKTIVLFMTDNGPQRERFKMGLRGLKGSVFQGGINVPLLVRGPGRFAPNVVDQLSAHVDLAPTILDWCGVVRPTNLDGISLRKWTEGKAATTERTVFFQWHRGDRPEAFRQSAVRTNRYKLVNGEELFDLQTDPSESKNVAADNSALVNDLRQRYQTWFKDVETSRGYAPVRIGVGSKFERTTLLNRQDWRGPKASWAADGLGYWELFVYRKRTYRVKAIFPRSAEARQAKLMVGGQEYSGTVAANQGECEWRVPLAKGELRLQSQVGEVGVHYVEISH